MKSIVPLAEESVTSLPTPCACTRPSTLIVPKSAVTATLPACAVTLAGVDVPVVISTFLFEATRLMSPNVDETFPATTSPNCEVSERLPGVPVVPAADTSVAVSVPFEVAVMEPAAVVRTLVSSTGAALSSVIEPRAEAISSPTFVAALMIPLVPAAPAVSTAVDPCIRLAPVMSVALVTATSPPTGRNRIGLVPSVMADVLRNETAVLVPGSVALAERRTEWPSALIAAIVVLAGIPAPTTSMPTLRACVENRLLTTALSLTVVAVSVIELSMFQAVFLFCVPFFTKTVVAPGKSAAVAASVARSQEVAAAT